MLPQYLRDELPAPLPPGEPLPARGAGPAVGVILDSLALALALLVVLRGAIDRNWPLLRTWTVVPFALLAAWAFLSTIWASDKFAAAVSASMWLGAAALLFIFAQTVRTWARLRIVAGVAAGLFLVCVAFGYIYRIIDLPNLIEDFQANKLAYFQERGWDPESFAAKNFEHRVMAGATGGFASSPNSFGATLVMLGFVMAGLAWQRWRERNEPAWAGLLALTLLPGAYILWTTGSRTAVGAALLAGIGLTLGFWKRDLLVRNRRLTFAAIVALIALGATSVIGVGLATQTLPHESLAFRWNYWRGAWGVFVDNPLRGVGFANFGDAYLAHRLPVAAEEVKDPHNLLVRFLTETGLVGALLAGTWLLCFIRSQTRPADRTDDQEGPRPGPPVLLQGLLWLVVVGLIVHSLAALDLAADSYYVFLEIVRRGLYGLLMLGALLLGTIRSAQDPAVETSPAPALLAAMLAGLAAALIHAMVDVVVFEPSVLASFVMLMGAVTGIRTPQATAPAGRRLLWPVTASVTVAVLAWVALFAFPLAIADRSAAQADELIRGGRGAAALVGYQSAIDWSPVSNSDYHHRAARAMAFARRSPEEAQASLEAAIAANPRAIPERVSLAGLYVGGFPQPRLAEAAELYVQILGLNPNDLGLRLQYADVLERLGKSAQTADELERVLDFNDQLDPEEPERLQTAELERIRGRIASLHGG